MMRHDSSVFSPYVNKQWWMCNTTKAINSWQKKAKPHHLCRYLRRLANTDDDCGKKRMARRKNKLTLAINHTSQTDFHAAQTKFSFQFAANHTAIAILFNATLTTLGSRRSTKVAEIVWPD